MELEVSKKGIEKNLNFFCTPTGGGEQSTTGQDLLHFHLPKDGANQWEPP
jgi:hypothetical protein